MKRLLSLLAAAVMVLPFVCSTKAKAVNFPLEEPIQSEWEYFYSALDRHFQGLSDRYRREYGLSYEIVSPNHDRLMGIFHEFCEKYGIMRNRECFEYLSELPEKYQQLTLF